MSQSVRFVKVEDVLYPEVVYGFPDNEEAIGIVEDMLNDELIVPSDSYELVTRWFEIGNGESGMDFYFSEETLINWEQEGCFEEAVEKLGYAVELISTDTVCVMHDEVEVE